MTAVCDSWPPGWAGRYQTPGGTSHQPWNTGSSPGTGKTNTVYSRYSAVIFLSRTHESLPMSYFHPYDCCSVHSIVLYMTTIYIKSLPGCNMHCHSRNPNYKPAIFVWAFTQEILQKRRIYMLTVKLLLLP